MQLGNHLGRISSSSVDDTNKESLKRTRSDPAIDRSAIISASARRAIHSTPETPTLKRSLSMNDINSAEVRETGHAAHRALHGEGTPETALILRNTLADQTPRTTLKTAAKTVLIGTINFFLFSSHYMLKSRSLVGLIASPILFTAALALALMDRAKLKEITSDVKNTVLKLMGNQSIHEGEVSTHSKTDRNVYKDSKAEAASNVSSILEWHETNRAALERENAFEAEVEPGVFLKKVIDEGVISYFYSSKTESGTKLLYEINQFPLDSYNGPKTSGFTKRLDLMFEAAIAKIGNDPRSEILTTLKEVYQERIQQECPINPAIMIDGGEAASTHYNLQHAKAEAILGEAFNAVQDSLSKMFNIHEPLAQLEKECVRDRGRPVIINQFKVSEEGRTFLSVQTPLFDRTIPSSIRTEKGLCNAVMTYSGYMQGETAVFTQEACRHSSFPPIAENNNYLRQRGAAENAYQELEAIVKKQVNLDSPPENSKAHPIEVDWNVMMLLTAKRLDHVRNRQYFVLGKWKGEGETLMLKESLNAVNTYANRPLKMTIDGKEVWIKANVTAMNLGANQAAAGNGILGKIPNAGIQSRQNARGFLEFEHKTDTFLLELASKHNINGLRRQLSEYQDAKNASSDKDFQNARALHTLRLSSKTARLEKALKNPDITSSNWFKRYNANREINIQNKKIYQLEKAFGKKAIDYTEKRKIDYTMKDAKLKELKGRILENLQAQIVENPQSEELKILRDVFINQAQFAESIIYNHNTNVTTVMNSQAIFIQTSSLMNSWTSFFCKSGEDRTGNVDVEVAARDLDRNLGRDASREGARAEIAAGLLPVLHETSAAINNTTHNSNAQGLQVGSIVNPASVKTLIDANKKMSTLAKSVVRKAAELKTPGFQSRLSGSFRLSRSSSSFG